MAYQKKAHLANVANAVSQSGNASNCTTVAMSVARKLLNKPILDARFFLESFVGERGLNGLNRLEEFLKKVPRDASNIKKPFINPFPHRPRIASAYKQVGNINNLSFVSNLLNKAPNNSSFIFASFKGGLEDGMKYTGGHAFNVIKDKNGVIKYYDGQLEKHLEYGAGLDKLLEKMGKHGYEVKLPNGRYESGNWYIFDASRL
nr:toxin glutamine deamidase domain-containing protein [uncultured Microscilla sp.]